MVANILKGTNVAFKIIDSPGTEREMTSFWVSGMPDFGNESVDVTVYGDLARRNNPGLESAAWSVQLQQDSTGTASPWFVFNTLLGGSVTTALFYPEGDASGRPEVKLQVRVLTMTPGGGPGEQGVFDVAMEIDGTRTIGTV